MRLSRKFGKIVNGEALDSVARHTRAFLRNRRFPARVTASGVIRSIDPERFEQIRRKYADPAAPADAPPKYLDLRTWMRINVQRVRELELDYAPPSSILDIGCGAGYFLYICKTLGHRVLGLDVGSFPMFRELTELLEVPRVIARVEAFRPLPKFDRKFDLITAHLICFNAHKSEKLWGPAEWEFFLNDLASHLTSGGRVWLELNREYDGSYYSPELAAFFRNQGAELHGYRVVFNRGTLVPVAAAPPASLDHHAAADVPLPRPRARAG
ncbi:MAG: class I SAM-dependent methyltransferase [Chthoniobacterales bacterium]